MKTTTQSKELQEKLLAHNIDKSALLFPNVNLILVPKKSEYNLKKYVSKKLLKLVDSNIDIAVEKCLVFLSNLASTYYTGERVKQLHSTILHEQSRNKDNTYIYSRIIDVLLVGTKQNGPIIEIDSTYVVGEKSKGYSITDTYFKVGLTDYYIKDASIVQRRNKIYYNHLNEIMDNPICLNLIKMYPNVDLPTVKEIKAEGRRLVKLGTTTKKGKILTMRNKHTDSYWKDVSNRSFVEDSILLFEYLTTRGFMLPSIGDNRSGGRVVDSFTLMPSWIRSMIKFNDEATLEADYGALHPNLCATIYKTNSPLISHDIVAEYLGVDRQVAKIEHLSFFNKHQNDMDRSPLFRYYMDNELSMMLRIKKDKRDNGYKVTSRKMFKMEVELMTEVSTRLNSIGIYVGYVYDALFTTQENIIMVTDVMNEVADEMNIKTIAK